jgi:hypothetical protein
MYIIQEADEARDSVQAHDSLMYIVHLNYRPFSAAVEKL